MNIETRTGIIFDLFRFSVNDGPGIRTTIFLKGCPLNCIWCHNPESIPFKPQLSFNARTCIHCMKCVNVCESGAHYIRNEKHQVDYSKCTLHNRCTEVCESESLSIVGYRQNVQEIIDIALKDIGFYKNSGGGITVSGGEPMSQFEFTFEIFKTAKKNGISTCLDTSGFASKNNFQKILPYADLFLFDYKATGEDSHKELTGVSQKGILENLEFLYSNNARIILRCPMIPGVNDTDKHLKAIAALDKKYPNLDAIELMPYHKMGNEKGIKVGITPQIDYLEDTDDIQKLEWIKKLHKFGCKKAVIG